MLLEIKQITKRFGGLIALHNVDLKVESGQIVGVIGPNGAGKTTLFNVISGFCSPTSGQIIFKGEDITGIRSDKVAKKGIGRTFQNTSLFDNYTVLENVIAAHHIWAKSNFIANIFNTKNFRAEEEKIRKKSLDIISLQSLLPYKNTLAKNLSYGHQRALEISVALAIRPKLLLLDEAASGMSRLETAKTTESVRRLRDRGTTIVLIEHNMRAVMGICDYVYVLNFGKNIAFGAPDEIKQNKEVVEAYLGTGEIIA